MRGDLGSDWKRAASKLAIVSVIGGLAGACSTDTMRFSQSPFSNPFDTAAAAGPEPEARTGSIGETPAGPVPTARVQRETVAPVRTAARPTSPASGRPGWSTQGGSTITVGSADTLQTISDRYGVPGSAILAANDLSSGKQVVAGRRLVIPVYSADAGGEQARTVRSAEPAPQAGRIVATRPIDVKKPAPRNVAEAATKPAKPRPGRKVAEKAPEPLRTAKPEKSARAEPSAAKPEPAKKPVRQAEAVEPAKPAKTPVRQAEAAKPAAPVRTAEAPRTAPKEPESTGTVAAEPAGGDFRWPARGRVINGFGSGGNEGVNIAVPDGTPVKAAGDGVVAYAGSEVKGYGNLVLIRHDNGYVTAYAHNGEIDVKRGQKVTRGQTIAKSGQTGNVTSPQLHFEVRKGSTPVDPMRHLASAN